LYGQAIPDAIRPDITRIRHVAYTALQSDGRRRNIFSKYCPAALDRRHTVAGGQRQEKTKIAFPIAVIPEGDYECGIGSRIGQFA
jgi:hypothetical protein